VAALVTLLMTVLHVGDSKMSVLMSVLMAVLVTSY
jgi:hypothetical protein